jgi:hypothetical protein
MIPATLLYTQIFLLFVVPGVSLAYPDSFGGLKLSKVFSKTEFRNDPGKGLTPTTSLIHGDTREGFWHYPVGVISKSFQPFFPGPKDLLNIEEIQLFVQKKC